MPPTTIPNTSGSTLFYQNYFTTTEPSIAQNVSSSIENEDFDEDISSGSSSYNHQQAVRVPSGLLGLSELLGPPELLELLAKAQQPNSI